VPSIGAGGGSIAWIEAETGVLKVGPRSAGARPGPACYGAGGTDPTVTDANLVLGRINPDYFLGGRMRLDADRAHAALATVAEPLSLTPERAAAAVIEIVDSQMADLIRRVTVERGLDPAGFTVFCYGGAGGLHAGAYARRLGCAQIVVPRTAAVFSAFGIAVGEAKRVAVASEPMREPFDLERWRARLGELERRLLAELEAEQLPTQSLLLQRFVDLQLSGQVHAVRVPVDDGDLAAADGGERVIRRFVELYESKYGAGTAYRQAGVEAITFTVEATARLPVPGTEWLPDEAGDAAQAAKGERSVYVGEAGGYEPVAVYDAERLRPGNELDGPAVIEADDTTVFVHPGQRLWVDGLLNLRIDLA
jgi:N-methylhydantoinase A